MNARCCIPPDSVRSGASATLVEPDPADRVRHELAVLAAKASHEPAAREQSGGDDLPHGRRRVASDL